SGLARSGVRMRLLPISPVAGAVVATTVAGQSQAGRDRGVKRSVAAADAGLNTAVYRLNKLTPKALFCVVVGATGLEMEPVQADGWCRTQTETLGDGEGFSYRVSAAVKVTGNSHGLLRRKIVAT